MEQMKWIILLIGVIVMIGLLEGVDAMTATGNADLIIPSSPKQSCMENCMLQDICQVLGNPKCQQCENNCQYLDAGQTQTTKNTYIEYNFDWGSTNISLSCVDGDGNAFVPANSFMRNNGNEWEFGALDDFGDYFNCTYYIDSSAILNDLVQPISEAVNETTEKLLDKTAYPSFYNYYPQGLNEPRHWYNFKDICSRENANCQWGIDKIAKTAWVSFMSDGYIDPTLQNISGCATLLNGFQYLQNQSFSTGNPCMIVDTNANVLYDGQGFNINDSGTTLGIFQLKDGANLTIQNAVLQSSSTGLSFILAASATANIYANNLTFYRGGFSDSLGSVMNIYMNNSKEWNASATSFIALINGFSILQLYNNYFENSTVAVRTTHFGGTRIINNTFNLSRTNAIRDSAGGNLIENNSFYNGTLSLFIDNADSDSVIGNYFYGCRDKTFGCTELITANSFFKNNVFNGSQKQLIYVYGTSYNANNNLFQDNTFINNTANASIVIRANSGGTALNNVFLNCTYENNSENMIGTGTTPTELLREWYYQAKSIDTIGNAVNGANVDVWNVSLGNPFVSLTTSANGLTSRASLIEYWKNSTAITFQNNFTINASYTGNAVQTTYYNLTNSHNVFDTFTFFVPYSNLSIIYPLSHIVYVKLNNTFVPCYGGMFTTTSNGEAGISLNASYQPVNFTTSTNNCFTFTKSTQAFYNGNDTLQLTSPSGGGVYMVDWRTGKSGSIHSFSGMIFVNDVQQNITYAKMKGGTTDTINMNSFALIRINYLDNITLRIRDDDSPPPGTLTIFQKNVALVKVAN
jgi:hypothetical protein